MLNPLYRLNDPAKVLSPSLLFYKDLIRQNLQRMLARAGSADRLRPHVKTHKTREIVRMQMDAGINKFKVATIAEAEMVAGLGVPDILLSYPLVGPNPSRFAALSRKYPGCRFSTIVDHPLQVEFLSQAWKGEAKPVGVLVDVDVGQHRTGIAAGEPALELYRLIARTPHLVPDGLHVYDGHNHQESLTDRSSAARPFLDQVFSMRENLQKQGIPIPRLVLGGTPTFPVYSPLQGTDIELSPGTCILNDHGYGSRFPDLCDFIPAATLLTRVISRPTPSRVTLDLGYKAMASDPPAGKRCILPELTQYEAVLHNEEHLVIETPEASRYQPGDVLYAIPTHICPTSAMHQFAYVVENGQVTEKWEIVARDRILTI